MGANEYKVSCHCGRVKGKFHYDKEECAAWMCNCSDCSMRGNTHIVIPEDDFQLDMKKESLEDATILYEWGSKIAKRYICKTCGILPWYRPRSNPDGYAITLKCIEWSFSHPKPKVEVKPFDGQNWEQFLQMSGIEKESKK